MVTKHKPDKILFGLTFFLIFYGLLVLASASLIRSQTIFDENYYYLKHQFIFGALMGLGLLFLAVRLKYTFWRKMSVLVFIVSLGLLFLVFLPQFSYPIRGVKRWIKIGSVVFQPSEFVKLGFILYLSAWLAGKTKVIRSFSKTVFPFLVLNIFLGVLFLLQPDIGSLLVIYGCSFLLFFLAGASYKQLFMIAISGLIALLLVVFISDYRLSRLKSFLEPEQEPLESSYQIRQALIGIGSGGVVGRGYGQSIQKKGFLPETIGDSIFVILVEELGLIGGVILIFSFLFLSLRGFRIAKRAPDYFSRLVSSGIIVLVVYQAFINIAAISGMIPLTGLTLPLVSYGSSSYVITLFSLGILLNISCYTKKIA